MKVYFQDLLPPFPKYDAETISVTATEVIALYCAHFKIDPLHCDLARGTHQNAYAVMLCNNWPIARAHFIPSR